MRLIALRWAILGLICTASAVAGAGEDRSAPSFDCQRVTSAVNHLICASPTLSALDRKLADDYAATLHQGGIDARQLAAQEAHWLHDIRNHCTEDACLTAAYTARDADILDMSLRAASPAAYADTRPFAAPATALSAARGLLGTRCEGGPSHPLPGTSTITDFSIITARGGYVVPLRVGGYPFAFWYAQPGGAAGTCTVRDVVALPPPMPGHRFLQCHVGDDSHGFAIRAGKTTTLAYWSIADESGKLVRVPIHVAGEQDLRCQQPETGE